MPATGLDHVAEAQRAHRELWRRGFTTDVLGGFDRLSGYALVVVPMHYLMTDAQAAALRAWVVAGGRLVVTFLSGVADEHARVRTGGYPGALRDLLGVRVEEFHPLAAGEAVPLSDGSTGSVWRETVHLTGAEAVARYPDGGPAITRHAVGAGHAWYVSTTLDRGYGDLLAAVAGEAGVAPVVPGTPPGVEVVRRTGGDRSWLFVLNHTAAARRVPADGVNVLTGAAVTGEIVVPAGAAAVVRTTAEPDRVDERLREALSPA
jgi:beta-galactosidase